MRLLCSLNVWNGVVLDLGEKRVSLYWCVLEFEAVIGVRCSMRPQTHPEYTTIAMTAMHLSSSSLIEWLPVWNCNRVAYVGPGRTESTFALLASVLEFESVIRAQHSMRHPDVLSKYTAYNNDDGCTFMFVECMTRCRAGPGRTESTFVSVWLNLRMLLVLVWCSMRS